LAAALAQMVAGLTVGRTKYVAVEGEMQEIAHVARALGERLGALVHEDADAFGKVSAAYKLPKDVGAAATARDEAIQVALLKAAQVPLETARACSDVARLAVTCAAKGNVNTVSDAGVAALLAEAACRGAAYNVQINAASLADRPKGEELADEVNALVDATRASAAVATARVEAAIG
jgi:glutamate formiminotransferase/formiminotetrahydrofolate cyclodeaminase